MEVENQSGTRTGHRKIWLKIMRAAAPELYMFFLFFIGCLATLATAMRTTLKKHFSQSLGISCYPSDPIGPGRE
jgi:hypothetical protein